MAVNGFAEHMDWWTDKLSDLTISPLTRDYPEASSDNVSKRSIEAVELLKGSTETTNALRRLSATYDSSVVLLSVLLALVSRWTGDDDISIGANAQQDGPPFVLRMPVSTNESFESLMEKTSTAVHESQSKATDLYALREKLGHATLFKFAAFSIGSPGSSSYATTDNVDLLLDYACGSDGDLILQARYNQRLFSSLRISGILLQICQFICRVAADPTASIGAIDFATEREQELVPDPTSDLEWSSFRGAIHDIFSANAEAHPDRTCVVETQSESGPERLFTYRQIHEASNVLAHHLVKSGLQRGDVVMIYSYRGVDLVVAVMGTLKAGGTFSVLDPAYPPDRQNIYLEVSQPRALVVIQKATEEAGELHESVRQYVKENLELYTEVPALRLHEDGSLTGGQRDGADAFDHVQKEKAKSPGVVVGPDSTPTLSFTSGSEGRPKGVRGRHYSLAFYFDWMAKTFNLSSDDKFTMLSGIAHDPIQRDMFTPLFLGAQLLVPSKNDIQNERLAEWMKKYGATVTHLTPAMGQILVGGATSVFERLHHAFFVGDILIKRDCRSLQSLAPNVAIVNMYGTTETQRAVSYYEIPSSNQRPGFLDGMKDVIPAGRGMYNVQMLVVNRFDPTKLCAVGEIGEIYVRASGLAEEYLGTPDLTKKKFLSNWFKGHEEGIQSDRARFEGQSRDKPWAQFYLGPRDRLYRSGDLGRYTPSGDVECSGRADDQVKIRGFRIELGEIDTHISQHPLVRENVTLVRRDKFEEQTLVSYVVPQLKAWETFLNESGRKDEPDDGTLAGRFHRFQTLQKTLQDYLRTKLPAYAVPTLIVPMRAMPLNPNGKIDKPKLPFPDTAMLSAGRRRKSSLLTTQSESEASLSLLWARLVPGLIAKSVKPTESFFDIGGDSMKAQQLAYHIRRSLGVDLQISKIYSRPHLKEMAIAVDQLKGLDSSHDQVSSTNNSTTTNGLTSDIEYGTDAVEILKELPTSFQAYNHDIPDNAVVFLTGATGFLGSFILSDLLNRTKPAIRKVITLIRARDPQSAIDRLKMTCQAYGVWRDEWIDRIECLPGSLGPPQFGVDEEQWTSLINEADIVIHNGAQVHWIDTYQTLKKPNVLGTLDAIKLCAGGKPKQFTFVSSTSVLDHDYYVFESERSISAGGDGISEADDLMGSSKDLGTGYGQSKWVSEYITREAGRRGLRGCIVRPGYVLGDSRSGVTNTDDFLIRMLKGCIQLRSRPNINNTVNMVPVDHVARTVVACAFHPATEQGVCVAHVTGHPRLRFNQFLATLETYGYTAQLTDYVPWASSLEEYVASNTDFALMPLFTFVANDLPSNTRAPELDDANAEASLYADRAWTGEDVSAGCGVTKTTIAKYLAYLTAINFVPSPGVGMSNGHKRGASIKGLPSIEISNAQRDALRNVGGRGTTA